MRFAIRRQPKVSGLSFSILSFETTLICTAEHAASPAHHLPRVFTTRSRPDETMNSGSRQGDEKGGFHVLERLGPGPGLTDRVANRRRYRGRDRYDHYDDDDRGPRVVQVTSPPTVDTAQAPQVIEVHEAAGGTTAASSRVLPVSATVIAADLWLVGGFFRRGWPGGGPAAPGRPLERRFEEWHRQQHAGAVRRLRRRPRRRE